MEFKEDYTIPKMIKDSADKFAEINAQYKRQKNGEFIPVLYREMFQLGLDFGAALLQLGLKREEPIGLISDNRAEWMQADIGIMSIGAIDVPRGCDATPLDLEKILSITECRFVIAENNSQVNKILNLHDKLPGIEKIITFDTKDDVKQEVKDSAKSKDVELYYFDDLIKEGQKWRIEHQGEVEAELEKGKIDDIATIIFTSGFMSSSVSKVMIFSI